VRAWGDAVTNTRFIEKTVENTVLSVAGATALEEVKAANNLGGEARFSRLGQGDLRLGKGDVGLHAYQPNAGGAVRSVDEARAIAGARGVDMPDWMVIRADANVPLGNSFATYKLGPRGPVPLGKLATWEDAAPDGVVAVRVDPSVFTSDEAIVGVLAHESHELTSLRAMLEQNGPMSWREINSKIAPPDDNLHGQAWDVADARVLAMRAATPEARTMYEECAESLQDKFDIKNDITR
jgi:hypothetical protein